MEADCIDKDHRAEEHLLNCQHHTFAQSCHTGIENIVQLEKIQDAVLRMHKIKMLAGELLSRHIQRCFKLSDGEVPVSLPKFTQTWCRQLFKEVSCLDNPKQGRHVLSDDPELTQTRHMMDVDLEINEPSRSGLSQMLSQEAILFASVIQTNIKKHYKKRLLRYVRWSLHTSETRVMSPDEYKIHKLNMLEVVEDICRVNGKPRQSPNSFHAWVDMYRMIFGLDRLLEENTIEQALSKTPELFLPSMRVMNRSFEGSGERTFSMLPLTRKFRPGFVSFDATTCREVLQLPMRETERAKIKARIVERTTEKLAGTWMSPKEKHALKHEKRKREAEENEQTRKQVLANETKEDKKHRIILEIAEAKERKRHKLMQIQNKKDLERGSIDAFFASFLNIRVNVGKGCTFNHSFKTDGVSLRLLFVKRVKPCREDSQRYNNTKPRRGIYAVDTLKMYSKLSVSNMQVIGIDPGMYDLIHAVGDDYLNDPGQRLCYSSAQRRTDKCSTLYAQKMRKEKPVSISHIEENLSKFNSRSCDSEKQNKYFRLRRENLNVFYDYYTQIKYRARRWRSFKKDQTSISKLINNIKGMRKKGKTLVLAYGSWAKSSAQFNIKGMAPCIGIGLRRRLAKEFIVADTPEHYTSKICSKCFDKCGPFEELEQKRRALKKERATTPEEIKKASRLTIRSIRRCQNAECGAILHRDRNAASNISTNFKLFYQGHSPLRTLTKIEQKMVDLTCGSCLSV